MERTNSMMAEKPICETYRATRSNEMWHIDTTVIRLLDGTRAYLHAVRSTSRPASARETPNALKHSAVFVDVELHESRDGSDAVERVEEQPLMFEGPPHGSPT